MCSNLYYFTKLFFTSRTNKQLAKHIQYINVYIMAVYFIVEYKQKVGVTDIDLKVVEENGFIAEPAITFLQTCTCRGLSCTQFTRGYLYTTCTRGC